MSLNQIHIFDSRDQAFKEDDVLQENIIFHATKGKKQEGVIITSSNDSQFESMTHREVSFDHVVKKDDPDQFIHIAVNDFDQGVIERMSLFTKTLPSLGLEVSTGPVVDFRLKDEIRQLPDKNTFPLIYPGHFSENYISWPKPKSKKPNAIIETQKSAPCLLPNGWYTIIRRFSSKEERRRVVAAIHNPSRIPGEKIGFENHLNLFHQQKAGLDPLIGKGLSIYLNSTLLDLFFRQFSGHTQVNATDLRMLHYPETDCLIRLGKKVSDSFPKQKEIDTILEEEIAKMAEKKLQLNPVKIKEKTENGMDILKAVGMPKGQLNERSSLTLLALLKLSPEQPWSKAGNPLIGITPIMDYIAQCYGKNYAPNSRETIRRFTMHQFVDAGIALSNPDKPDRPINSPKWVYQIEPDFLKLVTTFGTKKWDTSLSSYFFYFTPRYT